MIRRWLLAAVAVAFLGTGFVGCGEEPAPQKPPDKPKAKLVDTSKKVVEPKPKTDAPVEKKEAEKKADEK